MNRSRIRSIEKKAIPREDKGVQVGMVTVITKDGGYYLREDPETWYPSKDEATKAWRERHKEYQDSGTLIVQFFPYRDETSFRKTITRP